MDEHAKDTEHVEDLDATAEDSEDVKGGSTPQYRGDGAIKGKEKWLPGIERFGDGSV
jgi:hypothetical protein